MTKIALKMKQDKICKNSVRFTASKEDLAKFGVVKQPFTIYVPNEMILQDGKSPKEIEISISPD